MIVYYFFVKISLILIGEVYHRTNQVYLINGWMECNNRLQVNDRVMDMSMKSMDVSVNRLMERQENIWIHKQKWILMNILLMSVLLMIVLFSF